VFDIFVVLMGILVIIVIAITVPSSKKGLRKCPVCAEHVKIEALKCRFCGSDFVAAGRSPR